MAKDKIKAIEAPDVIAEPGAKHESNHPERVWGDTKIFYLPLMPTGKISNFFLRILVITFNNDLL
jgi:hypothetical protein